MDENEDTPTNEVERSYDVLVASADELDSEASPWGDSHFQRHYSWPAAKSILPELTDTSVLLAGCGRGDHVRWFREHGAEVTGVDVSGSAIENARQRFGDEASFYHADLTEPLDFVDDDAFDLVFSNLVFSHIREWRPVFEEFHRVLKAHGHLVVTTVHPQYIRSKADIDRYDTTEKLMNEWPGVEIPTFYRPMSAVVSPFVETGFRLEVFDEPKPQETYEEHHPERYTDALQDPELLVIRARAD